jgi:murein L,D-transpeptidase YcbB/YkuD
LSTFVAVARALMPACLAALMLGGAACTAEAPAETAAPLRVLVQSADHPDLRWSAFPDFRAEVERLYERAGWKPLWLRGTRPTDAALQLIARLAAADTLGLEPSDYDAVWLGAEAKRLSEDPGAAAADTLARFDLGLSVAAVRFASALHRGRLSPHQVHAQLFIPRSFLAVEMAVDSLRDARRQGSVLERLQPRLHHYQLLKNGLARYRALARDTTLAALPAVTRPVEPGEPYPVAAQLRHRLVAIGDLPEEGTRGKGEEDLYSADLVEGVKRFQVRNGIEADGVIGASTIALLNRPFARRVRQIELALERFRWLPPALSEPPVIVNIPAYRLYAFRGTTDREDDMLAMDVVVGNAFDTRTPMFAADMKYLIFRPYWEVPKSIATAELVPKALRDPDFLGRESMEIAEGESDRAPALPATRKNLERVGTELRLRQLPGPGNALGLVKFIFPNAHNVYLHDTPAKSLFASTRRDMSHGCIRVSDPTALAVHLLRDQAGWTPERIRAAMETGEDNTRIDLARPVPVLVVYTTAIANESGEVLFYPDIYGLDDDLDRLLARGYPYPK